VRVFVCDAAAVVCKSLVKYMKIYANEKREQHTERRRADSIVAAFYILHAAEFALNFFCSSAASLLSKAALRLLLFEARNPANFSKTDLRVDFAQNLQ
jgi:hypothetical protein